MKKIDIGVSPLTNTIFAGKSKLLKNGRGRTWIGDQVDVTDEVIRACFEYMYNKSKGTEGCKITIKGYGTMSFRQEVNDV